MRLKRILKNAYPAKMKLMGNMIIACKYAKNVNTKEGEELLRRAKREKNKKGMLIRHQPSVRFSSL